MLPEDRLDSLLSSSRGSSADPIRDEELGPLVDVAQRLAQLGAARPTAGFAAQLHADLLDHVAALRAQQDLDDQMLVAGDGSGPDDATVPLFTRVSPIRPAGWTDTRPYVADPMSAADLRSARRRRSGRGGRSRVLWQGIAAAIALLVCGGVLSVAANAQPGSPLYGIRQLAGHVGVASNPSAADRARQQLSDANAALTALNTVVAQHGGDTSYATALATLRKDEASAAATVNGVTTPDRAQLLAQLQDLWSRERETLRGALDQLSWENRLSTSQALGELGDTVPSISSATVTRVTSDGHGSGWRVELHGAGFAPGAVLVADGQRLDAETVETADTLSATFSSNGTDTPPHSLGVINPDGAAAQTDQIGAETGTGDQPTPGPEATPTPGNNHTGGDHGGTPTPTSGPTK